MDIVLLRVVSPVVTQMNDATSQIIMSADLIAMSTHGRSGLTRLLFGSVAEAVLRQVLKSVSSGSLI